MATLPLVVTHALACPGVLGVVTKLACAIIIGSGVGSVICSVIGGVIGSVIGSGICSCLEILVCLPACATLYRTETHSHTACCAHSACGLLWDINCLTSSYKNLSAHGHVASLPKRSGSA